MVPRWQKLLRNLIEGDDRQFDETSIAQIAPVNSKGNDFIR